MAVAFHQILLKLEHQFARGANEYFDYFFLSQYTLTNKFLAERRLPTQQFACLFFNHPIPFVINLEDKRLLWRR